MALKKSDAALWKFCSIVPHYFQRTLLSLKYRKLESGSPRPHSPYSYLRDVTCKFLNTFSIRLLMTTFQVRSLLGCTSFRLVKGKRPLMSGRTMGQVYCTKWHNSL